MKALVKSVIIKHGEIVYHCLNPALKSPTADHWPTSVNTVISSAQSS